MREYKEQIGIEEKLEPHEIAEEKIYNYEHEMKEKEHTLNEYKKRVEEFDLCLHAAVCPICGKSLYLDRSKIKKLRVRFTQYKHGRIRCLSGCKFVHPEIGNVSSPKSVKYMYCINYDIRKAHHALVTYGLCENDA